jgi:elongation factor P hydroxylase
MVGKDEVHQKALGYWNRPHVEGSIVVSKFQDTRIELRVLKHIVAKGHGLISAPKVSNKKT